MSFAAVAIGGVALTAAGTAYSSYQAGQQAEDAQNRMAASMGQATKAIDKYAMDYVNELEALDASFDPLDMEDAFNQLYEAVIQPMERDFDENVLPGIRAAYSGGVFGESAMLSGAAQESEAQARRGLAENKAQLRFQERDKAVARNYAEYDRRANLAGTIFGAKTAAPTLQAGQAPQIYQAESATIAAQLAANQAAWAIPGQVTGQCIPS
jgi:hypothetical protein